MGKLPKLCKIPEYAAHHHSSSPCANQTAAQAVSLHLLMQLQQLLLPLLPLLLLLEVALQPSVLRLTGQDKQLVLE
jgi:hypothetical protein